MLNKYTYSKRAANQLKTIYQKTVNQWGFAQADKYDAGLEKTVQLLADNPNMGRQCDEIHQGYRRHEYERHIIFYRKRPHDIFITAIIYDGKDLTRIFST